MALNAGEVILNGVDTHSGSGLSYSLFRALVAKHQDSGFTWLYPDLQNRVSRREDPDLWQTVEDQNYQQKLDILSFYKDMAVAIATAVVDELTNNAEVTVTITTSDGALQRVGGVDTLAPSDDRTISGVIE